MTDKTEERLLKENVEKLKELVLKEAEKEIDPKDKEFKKAMTNVIDRIIKMPKSPPIQHFEYKEDITISDFVDWFDKTELYYNIGRDYIEEKEGSCCCVDKAFKRYLRPECGKVFNIISKQAQRQTKAEYEKEIDLLKEVIKGYKQDKILQEKEIRQECRGKFKEMVENIKIMINDPWTNGLGECICPECWEHREVDEKRTKECMFIKINEIINKELQKADEMFNEEEKK